MVKTSKGGALRPALVLLLASTATPALAQEAQAEPAAPAAAADTNDGTDIVVTAQKRSERLQEVPIAVSALGGDSLEKQRVTQADELAGKIVNLQLTSTVGDNTPIFALRGVSMSDYSLNQASPVATYYDEVYKGNSPSWASRCTTSSASRCCAGRKGRSMARTPPAARSI